MDSNARAILWDILHDLRTVSSRLDQAAWQLNQMRGVGTELFAQRLQVLADKYDKARSELSKL